MEGETSQRERSKREREALPETRETREARTGSTNIRGNNTSQDLTAFRSKGEKRSSSTRQTEQGKRRTEGKTSRQHPRQGTGRQKTGTGDAIKTEEIRLSKGPTLKNGGHGPKQ